MIGLFIDLCLYVDVAHRHVYFIKVNLTKVL